MAKKSNFLFVLIILTIVFGVYALASRNPSVQPAKQTDMTEESLDNGILSGDQGDGERLHSEDVMKVSDMNTIDNAEATFAEGNIGSAESAKNIDSTKEIDRSKEIDSTLNNDASSAEMKSGTEAPSADNGLNIENTNNNSNKDNANKDHTIKDYTSEENVSNTDNKIDTDKPSKPGNTSIEDNSYVTDGTGKMDSDQDSVLTNDSQLPPETLAILPEKAKEYGIDTTGLTDMEILMAIKQKELEMFGLKEEIPIKPLKLTAEQRSELLNKAAGYQIDITGLTDEQIYEKVLQKDKEAAIAKAKQAGIETDGLTFEQVMQKVAEQDSEQDAKNQEAYKTSILQDAQALGINTTGLTYEQIKEKVYEIRIPELIQRAIEIGIAYEGLDYESLLRQIKAKEIELWDTK